MCPGVSLGLANVEFPLAALLYHFNRKLPSGIKAEDLDITENVGAAAGRRKNLISMISKPPNNDLNWWQFGVFIDKIDEVLHIAIHVTIAFGFCDWRIV
ncbi:hypothetical protein RJ639_022694 [Escallonia herrerae]|uniref:Cytochrome P450 n=1 Tax=Escallonia herrerae TaxID=1293975 RepID=A0AA89ACG9_9ASTE|nr:hypothetical protein RJ639_022694 [Escallonia herrerae]